MKTIIKTILITIALSIGVFANAQDKPLTFGVKAGMNLSNFSGDGAKGSDAKVGFNVGLTLDYAFSQDLYLMTGLEFSMKGAKDEGPVSEGDVSFNGKETSNPMYLQIPIHIGYKFPVTDNTNLVLHVGPYVAYGIAGKYKLDGIGTVGDVSGHIKPEIDFFSDDRAKRFDFGLGLGIGVEFGKFGVGLGYDLGLLNISQYKEAKVRNMNAYLTVGYKF